MNIIKRAIISGGGTGGHIYPAISIADEIKKRNPDAEILFIGASDRMEMKKVPEAGYDIKGLDVKGLDRKNILKNITIIYNFWKSTRKAKEIIKEFNPQIVIGVGGYASASVVKVANSMSIPTLIQEQNSYPGISNKLLGKNVDKICVAYDNMERFFPKNKIVKTGTPCREKLIYTSESVSEARKFFGLEPSKKTLLVVGGSLGAKTLNESIVNGISEYMKNNIQIIWQCGGYYFEKEKEKLEQLPMEKTKNIKLLDFIANMNLAYKAADLVVSRAGAGSIAELCILQKPSILIPSPNVAEDHQTKNAKTLVDNNAAILVTDKDAPTKLTDIVIETIKSKEKLNELSINIIAMAELDSASRIVDEAQKLIKTNKN